MAQIWSDVSDAMHNVIYDNATKTFRFRWAFVTFSGETQDKAEVRWRKAGDFTGFNIRQISQLPDDEIFPATNFATVGRHSFSYGFNITAIDIPIKTLSAGPWIFQVRFWQTGGTEWSGWKSHALEIDPYEERQFFSGAGTSVVKGPHAQTEGEYGAKVEVMSAAGISAVSSNESVFNVWETNKYLKLSNGDVEAVPEHRHNGTIIGRVERTS